MTNEEIIAATVNDVRRRVADLERKAAVEPHRVGGTWGRNANQSIPNTTLTAISWDSETRDSDGFLTPTSSTLTVPTSRGGLYAITTSLAFAITALGQNFVRILAGGSVYDFSGNTTGSIQSGTVVVPLADGGTVQVQTFQLSGGAVNVTGQLQVHRIGA